MPFFLLSKENSLEPFNWSAAQWTSIVGAKSLGRMTHTGKCGSMAQPQECTCSPDKPHTCLEGGCSLDLVVCSAGLALPADEELFLPPKVLSLSDLYFGNFDRPAEFVDFFEKNKVRGTNLCKKAGAL